jgi:Tol biopolymer transport system component
MMVVYSARLDSAPGVVPYNGIFEERADGTGLKVLAESRGNVYYNWPQWALGGTKIIYTVRSGPPVNSADPFPKFENLWEMNPDGSGKRPLTLYNFRAVQPKVSADGRSVIFTAKNPQYPLYAVYKLDLLTLQATNLSQTTRPDGAVDADPKWTPDGRIVMSATEPNLPGTQIEEMDADGSNRQMLVGDGNFNTDPEFSPDGGRLAYSAFDGPNPVLPGATLDPDNPDDTPLNPQGWFVKVRNQTTGAITDLTEGQACTGSGVSCRPGQSSGWKPVWSPDGGTVAWTGRLDATTTCICAANADGSDPRALITSHSLQIKWFDWTAPGGQAPSTAVPDSLIGSARSPSRLLISDGATPSTPSQILDEPVDMMGTDDAGTSSTQNPTEGTWSEHRAAMTFVASAPFDPTHPVYSPPPPPGQQIHEHFTLDELDPLLPAPYPPSGISPERQVFLRRPNGAIDQLTTPWTEDWRDALRVGDARSNTDPVISPNGRYVVFTNHSSLTGESSLLRLDVLTGEVLSLTNGTAGALQVNDSLPKWSPDSTRIAFTWTEGLDTNVYVMNAVDGTHVMDVSNDDGYDMDPAWSPDGSSIVFSHYDGTLVPTAAEVEGLGGLPRTGWSLVRVDLGTGRQSVLTTPTDSPTWKPAFSPDGSQIAFIGWKYRTTDIFLTTPQGAPVHPLLITPLINETSVDWK